jgi:hypothetical protein
MLFAAQSADWQPTPSLRSVARFSAVGRLLWSTGAGQVAGGRGRAWGLLAPPASAGEPLLLLLVWLLGGALLLIGSWWPGSHLHLPPPHRPLAPNPKGRFVQAAARSGEAAPPSPPGHSGPPRWACCWFCSWPWSCASGTFAAACRLAVSAEMCGGAASGPGPTALQHRLVCNPALAGPDLVLLDSQQPAQSAAGRRSARAAGVPAFAGVDATVAPAYAPLHCSPPALAPVWSLAGAQTPGFVVLLISLAPRLALRSLSAVMAAGGEQQVRQQACFLSKFLCCAQPLRSGFCSCWHSWSGMPETTGGGRAGQRRRRPAAACAVAAPVLGLPSTSLTWPEPGHRPLLAAALLRPEIIPTAPLPAACSTCSQLALAVTGAGTRRAPAAPPPRCCGLAARAHRGSSGQRRFGDGLPTLALLPRCLRAGSKHGGVSDRLLGSVAAWRRTLSPVRLVVTANLGPLLFADVQPSCSPVREHAQKGGAQCLSMPC